MTHATCPNYLDAYSATLQNEVFVVTDTSHVKNPYGPSSKVGCSSTSPTVSSAAGRWTVTGLWGTTASQIAVAAVDGAAYLTKFTSAAALLDSTKNNFILSHCPIYAMNCEDRSDGNGHQYYWLEPILQKALALSGMLNVKNPITQLPVVSMIMSGHMHWFQYNKVANFPPQVVFGHGGTKLLEAALDVSVMQSSTFVGYNMTGPVTEASSERLFGYVVMGRSGGSYTLSARDGTNTQHFFTSVGMSTTLNHALALPTSANGSDGSQNSTLEDGWIAFITLLAVFGLVILIVGIIFTQGSGKPSQPTDSSDCASAPKESVAGIEADEAESAPVDLPPSAATRECC